MAEGNWTFLSNHGHVLVYVARHPEALITDIADAVGITARATQSILNDLVDAGYLLRTRVGRRNVYEVDGSQPLRHPIESEHKVGQLIASLR